jgi:hypothetical protein
MLKRLLLPFVQFIQHLLCWTIGLRQPETARFYRIIYLAAKAYYRRRWDEAEARAQEGLELAERFTTDWNYGNVIHDCHQILGLLRLREGNVEAARQHLFAAGNTPGSPQLNSFGPSMELARELLLCGERQAVVEYLDLVARFWTRQKDPRFRDIARQHKLLLKQWKAEVQEGKVPAYPLWTRHIK